MYSKATSGPIDQGTAGRLASQPRTTTYYTRCIFFSTVCRGKTFLIALVVARHFERSGQFVGKHDDGVIPTQHLTGRTREISRDKRMLGMAVAMTPNRVVIARLNFAKNLKSGILDRRTDMATKANNTVVGVVTSHEEARKELCV